MWHLRNTQNFSQLHHDECAETEESGQFLSFAKRSREVHRSLPSQDYHQDFWDKILSYPSEKAECYNPCYGDPLNAFSRGPAEMVCADVRGMKRARQENLSVETLPSPAQLMGRRKKGGRQVQRADMAQRHAAVVTQHIGELRRKQGAIEKMKKEKWWGSTLGYTTENSCFFDNENLTSPEIPRSLEPSHTHTQFTASSQTNLNPNPSTLNTQEFEMLAPGGNPMMSFVVMGTAQRKAQRNWDTPCFDTHCQDMPHLDSTYTNIPYLCHTKFWGFPSVL